MATFLDVGLVQHFSVIFPVLLVFVIVFALLQKSKLLGDNKGLHSLIALSLAIMMLFTPGVVQVINIMAPWFVMVFLLIIFFMLILISFGTKWESIVKYTTSWDTPHWFLLVIGVIIFVGALASVYGTALLPYSGAEAGNATATSAEGLTTDTGNFNANVGRVIFHPKTIGTVFLLMVGSLTIKLLTKSAH